AENSGRIAVMSAEGGLFEAVGRYSRDGAPNLEVLKKAHCGDEIRVDRQSRESEYVRKPALTLALTAQPSVLRRLVKNDGLRGQGILARILFAVPRSNVGSRDVRAKPLGTEVEGEYRRAVRKVLNLEWRTGGRDGAREPHVLRFDDEAEELLANFS